MPKLFDLGKPETFLKAAKIIERQPKLSQTYLHDDDGNYCTMGAVLKVLKIDTKPDWNEEKEELPEIRMLALTLDEFHGRWACVSNWNDKPGRTPAEAAKFLRLAAEFCKYYDLISEKQYGIAGRHVENMHKEFRLANA